MQWVVFSKIMLRLVPFILVLVSGMTKAHEVRPAYLEIAEQAEQQYDVLWKVPAKANLRMGLYLQFPKQCQQRGMVKKGIKGGAYLERLRLHCVGGIESETIHINGLQTTLTDALVRYARLDGSEQVIRVMPQAPHFSLQASPSIWTTASTYLWLGIEHILSGIDHLLFVLALLMLVVQWRLLVVTITAFTLSHSITLIASTLGWVELATAPVEAVIALSIVFVAAEIIRGLHGRPGMTSRWPWLVAFSFGLLHGFGFAGALIDIGLPQTSVPLALLMFNIGVEIGQLLFIISVLLAMGLIRRIAPIDFKQCKMLTSILIGTCASYWFYEKFGLILLL